MWPTTIAGWVGLAATTTVVLTAMLGLVIRLARQHIASSIDKKLTDRIEAAVLNGNAPMAARLDAINTQLVTQDGELARICERTRSIEVTINNGLCDRQKRIEAKMDRLFEHLLWDGTERRVDET